MSDESVLVICILFGIALMIAGILSYQGWHEARLARQTRIEIPIQSAWRSALAALVGILVVPVLVGVIGAATDPLLRSHALAAVLISIIGGGACLVAILLATRKLRQIGSLVLTSEHLELSYRGERWTLDLARPFELLEGKMLAPSSVTAQVVVLTQDERSWGFAYGLSLGQKAYGETEIALRVGPPLLAGETRVLHARLRSLEATRPAPREV